MRLIIFIVALSVGMTTSLGTMNIASAGKGKLGCMNGCNKRCHGAKNKAKCVGMCRRACG